LEYQTSHFEEPSTQVFSQLVIPFIEDYVYSISYLVSKSHIEDIIHAYQKMHEEKISCTIHASHEPHVETHMHASRETKRGSLTSNSILTFSKKKLYKQIGYLSFFKKNT
jgi:hypothetical protein